MKALQTKTFRRFARKTLRKECNLLPRDIIPVTSRKAAFRAYASGDFVAGIVKQLKIKRETLRAVPNIERIKAETPALQLPPSMPKGAAAKIEKWEDTREQNGMIVITLKSGFIFDLTNTKTQAAINVKEAIAVMRTVKAV